MNPIHEAGCRFAGCRKSTFGTSQTYADMPNSSISDCRTTTNTAISYASGRASARGSTTNLLTHTSGIGNHVESPAFAEAFREVAQNPDSSLAPEELVAFVLNQPPLFSPGDGWNYSDTGYLLVGMIIEKATGRSYYEEVTERFLRPVGLEHTTPSNRRELPFGRVFGVRKLRRPAAAGLRTPAPTGQR